MGRPFRWLVVTLAAVCLSSVAYATPVDVGEVGDLWEEAPETAPAERELEDNGLDSPGVVKYLLHVESQGVDKRTTNSGESGDEKYGDGNYQGDIVLTKEQLEMVKQLTINGTGKKGSQQKRKLYKFAKLWPGKTVYYHPFECKSDTQGRDYFGRVSKTRSGRTCQRWNSQSPHKHSRTNPSKFPETKLSEAANYCRNPDGESGGPWCYTTDSNKRWEYCSVPSCSGSTRAWANKIMIGINHIERSTCVRFKPRTSGYRLRFVSGSGCSSSLGMTSSSGQKVSLKSNGCMSKGTVVHEILHAMGFHHEQTRPDRDSYITVHFNNIKSTMKFNFQKTHIDTRGVPYDIQSVMQYGSKAFSTNGKRTITAKGKDDDLLGQREGMTMYDRQIVNQVYGCPNIGAPNLNHCTWVGTAPFCGGKAKDCTDRGMTYSHSNKKGDGATCWTGKKVCCKSPCKKWYGTSPACRGVESDCEKDGLFMMFMGFAGDGKKCWSGKKICCGG